MDSYLVSADEAELLIRSLELEVVSGVEDELQAALHTRCTQCPVGWDESETPKLRGMQIEFEVEKGAGSPSELALDDVVGDSLEVRGIFVVEKGISQRQTAQVVELKFFSADVEGVAPLLGVSIQ